MRNLHPMPTSEERHRMIAQTAYFQAERRGFAEGDPIKDWLAAEAEIEKLLMGNRQPGLQKQDLAAYVKKRLEMKKLMADTHGAVNADSIKRAFNRVNTELKEIGEFVPETVDKARHMLRREMTASVEKMGSKWKTFSGRSTQMFNVWEEKGVNFFNRASRTLNDWAKKYRHKK